LYDNQKDEVDFGLYNDGSDFIIDAYQGSGLDDKIVFMGNQQDEGYYALIVLQRQTEKIGRNDPDIQTSSSSHVEVEFYKADIDMQPEMSPEFVSHLKSAVSSGTFQDRGYLNGYRLRPLSETLSDVFVNYRG
jgi:hypothetical protein